VKVLDPIDMDTLMKDVAITMCMLKMIMPLVFFDVIIVEDYDVDVRNIRNGVVDIRNNVVVKCCK